MFVCFDSFLILFGRFNAVVCSLCYLSTYQPLFLPHLFPMLNEKGQDKNGREAMCFLSISQTHHSSYIWLCDVSTLLIKPIAYISILKTPVLIEVCVTSYHHASGKLPTIMIEMTFVTFSLCSMTDRLSN